MAVSKHLVASGLVFYNDKLLLINHKKLQTWIYPGGHLEKNESPIEAIKREVKEETGYIVEIVSDEHFFYKDNLVSTEPRPYCVMKEVIAEGDESEHEHVDFVYLCRISTEINLPHENICSKWVTYEEIKTLEMFDNFRELANCAFDYYYMNKIKFIQNEEEERCKRLEIFGERYDI